MKFAHRIGVQLGHNSWEHMRRKALVKLQAPAIRCQILIALVVNFQFLLFQFVVRSKGVSPDFLVFYETTVRFVSGESVYFPEQGKVGYAPSLVYLLLSPFTLVDSTTASNLFILLQYFLILTLTLLLSRYLSVKEILVTATILNVSFSLRSIISNGQIGLFVLILQVIFLILIENKTRKSTIIRAFVLFTIWELKPYLILPYLVYLTFKRKLEVVFFIVFALLFQIIYLIINPTSTIIHYIELLSKRALQTGQEIDQSSILSFLEGNKILFALFIIIIIYFALKNLPSSEENRAVIFFLIAPIISIYFHRQDSIFAAFILSLIVYKMNKNVALLSAFLLIHAGSSNTYFVVQLGLMFALLVLLVPFRLPGSALVLFGMGAYSFWISEVSYEAGIIGTYGIWTKIVFIFQSLVLVVFMRLCARNAFQLQLFSRAKN